MENLNQHLCKMQEQLNILKLRCQTQQIMLKKLSREKQELLYTNKIIKKDLLKIYNNTIEDEPLQTILDDMMTLIMTIKTGESE